MTDFLIGLCVGVVIMGIPILIVLVMASKALDNVVAFMRSVWEGEKK